MRCGSSVGSFADLGGVGRGGQGWGRSRGAAPTCGSGSTVVGWRGEAGQGVCDDSHLSPSIEVTLSSPDLAGKLCPVVPAGIPPPVSPVGPCGMTSPSDLTSIGPVVPGSDPVGPVGPYIARERKTWREYCALIYRKRFGPMGVRRDELLSDESDCEHTYHVAGWQYLK